MPHPSFRLTLLASFMLIAGILGAAAAGGWLSLERFSRMSWDGSRMALGLTSALQSLGERTVDLERSARQYRVLREPALRARFDAAHDEALAALAVLQDNLPGLSGHVAEWRSAAAALRAGLDDGDDTDAAADLPRLLARLAALNDQFAARVREALSTGNAALLGALDRSREQLAGQLAAAFAAALALAVLAGWWTLRPLQRLERAIVRLGDNRLDEPVAVGGPSDLRRLGRRLDWLRQRLAALEADRNRVLRHVSHELKTPLASLREGIALLRDGTIGPLEDGQREVAAILDQNARLLQARIEQLLDFHAVQFDAARLMREPVDARGIADQVAADQRLPARAKGVRLEVDGSAGSLHADAAKLETALSNVVANAIAYAPAGSVVRVALNRDGGKVVIDCIDDGPGIPPAELDRVFEPFFRGSIAAARPNKGNGLGLAIARELVAAHGGTIAALPAARGAHFRMELPDAY
ncbi:sensor histidine kinase [Thauera sinica]|uniref:Signal transduction histidine-protein kinase/phosphatase MprB n=1 Tax=Thauera sinica TaxID=2665146 RepID=A0ABW1ALS8_9RHOO|nr:ATP-binding protein [Thauera sp. K11]ATE60820.1 two-component sensor histidine kinase [Thauera sp. K11]